MCENSRLFNGWSGDQKTKDRIFKSEHVLHYKAQTVR